MYIKNGRISKWSPKIKKNKEKHIKLCLVSSGGGHLYQMMYLKKWWKKYDRFWISFKRTEITSQLRGEKKYYAFYPESRNVINAFKNLFIAFKILSYEKPDVIISCGAGIAPPFFYVGKLLGSKLIFIEPIDYIKYPSLSGRLVEPITDHLLVQNREQLQFFRRAKYIGALL